MAESTLEKIERLEKEVAELKVTTANNQQQQLLELVAQKQLALEASLSSLVKTVHGLVSTLQTKNIISGKDIMASILALDEQNDRERINGALESGVIKEVETVSSNSIVVTSQSKMSLSQPENNDELTSFFVLEMNSPSIPKQIKDDLNGRKVGDTIPLDKNEDSVVMASVKAIYELVDLQKAGE